MSQRIGGIVHFRPIDWSGRPTCHAAMIVADQNGAVTLEVVDQAGGHYVMSPVAEWVPDERHPSLPPTQGMWHERGHCQ